MKFRQYQNSDLEIIRDIFFQNAVVKEFSSLEKKESFFNKYMAHYLNNYFESTFVVTVDEKTAGYITICPDTRCDEKLMELNPSLLQYKNYFDQYPAHLHINISNKFHSMGLGSKLLNYALANADFDRGIHLITAINAINVNFYLRLGFEKISTFEDGNIMLGKLVD